MPFLIDLITSEEHILHSSINKSLGKPQLQNFSVLNLVLNLVLQ